MLQHEPRRHGAILCYRQESGSFDLNQAALDTLIRGQPLPAIPADEPDIVELTIPVAVSLR